ncbi:hypothetical protein BGX33_002212, partial [Mortierella sp. NVP41]
MDPRRLLTTPYVVPAVPAVSAVPAVPDAPAVPVVHAVPAVPVVHAALAAPAVRVFGNGLAAHKEQDDTVYRTLGRMNV